MKYIVHLSHYMISIITCDCYWPILASVTYTDNLTQSTGFLSGHKISRLVLLLSVWGRRRWFLLSSSNPRVVSLNHILLYKFIVDESNSSKLWQHQPRHRYQFHIIPYRYLLTISFWKSRWSNLEIKWLCFIPVVTIQGQIQEASPQE